MNKEKKMALLVFLAGLAFVAGLAVIGTLFEAFVLISLWGWFIVPTFHLPVISYPVAIGISAMVGLLTRQFSPVVEEQKIERYTQAVIAPAIVLLVGWIAKQYI